MENTNLIYENHKYKKLLMELEEFEKDRIYCKHDFQHFIDVGRIMYILVLEEGLKYSKDMIYSTALLHDIGRVMEYRSGIDHDIASFDLAKEFLELTTFDEDEKNMILGAIANHRKLSTDTYEKLFYRADKLSRPCHICPARASCKWDDEKKNMRIFI